MESKELTVQKFADLAGVTVRTLHHYDEIGLLKPASIRQNGYRYYGEEEISRLQQILYFRELEFSLEEIRVILASPKYELKKALQQQKELLELKRKRLDKLIQILDKKIKKKEKNMSQNEDKQAFAALSDEEIQKHREEAKKEYGDNYQDKTKDFNNKQMNALLAKGSDLSLRIAKVMQEGKKPEDKETQELIAEHYQYIQNFWDCNLEAYKNLGQMYVDDERFTQNIDKIASGLAEFMRDAMEVYSQN